jgi:hypothetical protein
VCLESRTTGPAPGTSPWCMLPSLMGLWLGFGQNTLFFEGVPDPLFLTLCVRNAAVVGRESHF